MHVAGEDVRLVRCVDRRPPVLKPELASVCDASL
jgi:hypothetical protein